MKKILSVLLAVLLCLGLVACGTKGPKGTYKDNMGFSQLTFSGSNVEYISIMKQEPVKGSYTIEDNKITVSYENGNSDSFIYDFEKNTLDWNGMGKLIYTRETK